MLKVSLTGNFLLTVLWSGPPPLHEKATSQDLNAALFYLYLCEYNLSECYQDDPNSCSLHHPWIQHLVWRNDKKVKYLIGLISCWPVVYIGVDCVNDWLIFVVAMDSWFHSYNFLMDPKTYSIITSPWLVGCLIDCLLDF